MNSPDTWHEAEVVDTELPTLPDEAHNYLIDLISNDHHLLTHNHDTGQWILTCSNGCGDKQLNAEHCGQLEDYELIEHNTNVSLPETPDGETIIPFELTWDALEYLRLFVPLAKVFLHREENRRNTYNTAHLSILDQLGYFASQTNNQHDLVDSFALLLAGEGTLHQHKNGRWRFIYNHGIPSVPVRGYIADALITAKLFTTTPEVDALHATRGYTRGYVLSRIGIDLATDLLNDKFDPYDARLNIHEYLRWQLQEHYSWTQLIPAFHNASPTFDPNDPETILYWLTVHTTYEPATRYTDPGFQVLIDRYRHLVITNADVFVANATQTSAHQNTTRHLL